MDLRCARLHNQKLARPEPCPPEDIVRWLCAVQAQDYAGARWALGLRTVGITDADVESAFDAGRVLRTHVLRPTWHFVVADDIRWLLSLTGPRVRALNEPYYRRAGLDARTLVRTRRTIERALRGNKALTRNELGLTLARAGMRFDAHTMSYVMMDAELEALVCSGGRRAKQFTYALLDERAPRGRTLSRDEALAELTKRYFSSHGPATVRDFAWWSGLTLRDARLGIEMNSGALEQADVENGTYWFVESRRPGTAPAAASAFLLPNYDEYLIAYRERGPTVTIRSRGGAAEFVHHLIVDGRVAGSWRRMLKPGAVHVDVSPFAPLSRAAARAIRAAAQRYGEFLGMPVVLSLS